MSMDERTIQRKIYFDVISASCVVMPNFAPAGWYECDLFRVTKAGFFYEYEIKLSASDFRRDREKHRYDWKSQSSTSKHMQIKARDERGPSRFYYVMPAELAEKLRPEIPEWAGLLEIVGDRYWPHCSKQAPILHKKKITDIRIRQAKTSALHRFWDLYLRMPDLLRIQRAETEKV